MLIVVVALYSWIHSFTEHSLFPAFFPLLSYHFNSPSLSMLHYDLLCTGSALKCWLCCVNVCLFSPINHCLVPLQVSEKCSNNKEFPSSLQAWGQHTQWGVCIPSTCKTYQHFHYKCLTSLHNEKDPSIASWLPIWGILIPKLQLQPTCSLPFPHSQLLLPIFQLI